jgi:hypothetical protein
MKLSNLNPVVGNISEAISSKLSASMGQMVTYEPTALLFNLDQSVTKLMPGAFSIERREQIPFSDRKYFSNAPLGTQDHIELLKTFETYLLSRPTRI